MRNRWNRLSHEKKQWIVIGVGIMAVFLFWRCLYWYGQWKEWERCNEQILSYSSLLPADANHTQDAVQWLAQPEDCLAVVQEQAQQHQLQLISFQAITQENQQYQMEVNGTYDSYIHFLNM